MKMALLLFHTDLIKFFFSYKHRLDYSLFLLLGLFSSPSIVPRKITEGVRLVSIILGKQKFWRTGGLNQNNS